jgi:hypothetical protein
MTAFTLSVNINDDLFATTNERDEFAAKLAILLAATAEIQAPGKIDVDVTES